MVMDISPKELGENIRALRKEKGITIKELARRMNVSTSYISMLENGKTGKTMPVTIKKVSDALRIPYNSFLNLSGYYKKKNNDKNNFCDIINEYVQASDKTLDEISHESKIDVECLIDLINSTNNKPFEQRQLSNEQINALEKTLGIEKDLLTLMHHSDIQMREFRETMKNLAGVTEKTLQLGFKNIFDEIGKGLKVNLKNLSNLAKDALESDSYKQYLRLEEKINNYEFDLFDLLDWDFMGGFDIYYKDKLLTDEQKEKVKLMLKTLLE